METPYRMCRSLQRRARSQPPRDIPIGCSYVWKTTQNGKTVDSDGNSIFADDWHTSLDLGSKGGKTEIEVTAKSRHFKDKKKFRQKVVLVVVKESDFDKATFDSKQVGTDKAFSRDDKGKLHTNPDQKILSVEDESSATDLASGGIRELAKQGKISESDRETLMEQATNQRAALKEIQDKVKNGTPYLVRGTFVSREDSSTTELKLMMHVLEQKTEGGIAFYNLILHDLTMGDGTQHPGMAFQFLDHERPTSVFQMLEGEALEAMADHFHAHNDYPKGTLHLAAQRLTSGAVWERTLDTNNWRKKTKKVLGTVAMIGGVALLVVPGGGALAVGLMVVSGAAGATSIALEIEDRVEKEGTLKFDRRLVLDLLQLASTVLSFGALSTALREASMVAKSRYMLSMVGIDAAQGFVIAVDTRDALRKIDAETAVKLAAAKTDEERKLILSERDRQVAEVIGGAVVSGGFLLVSLGGGIKQVMATTRAGKQFAVREPVKALAARSTTEIQDALANQRFIHENRAVVLTEAESHFLEAQLMQPRDKAPAGDPARPTSKELPKPPAPAPESKGHPEEHKAPHERTTDKMPAVDSEGNAPSEDHKPPHERTTAKMQAVDPAKVPGHEATRVTFEGNGDTIGARAAKVTPEPGYFDVVVHGDPHSFWVLHNGSWVPVKPNSVRKWLSRQPGYHGQKIRLISCEAGAAGDGVAQAMANGMGVEVKAPTETLWVHDDGRMTIGADATQPSTGTWRDFSPAAHLEATPRADEPGKVGATEPHEPLPRDEHVAPDLDSSTSRPASKEPTTTKSDGPASLGTKQNAPVGDTANESLPPRKNSGEFADPELEKQYQDYRKRKHATVEHPRGRKAWKERVAWCKDHRPVARGNRFNKSVAKRRLYTYNEVHLEDGTRLDSYEHNGTPERISRKATDFLAITDAEFKGYLNEIDAKYPRGKKIRSNKYPKLDGKRLRGEAVLEVPLENLDPKDPKYADPALRAKLDETRARFEQLADDAGVELRYTVE